MTVADPVTVKGLFKTRWDSLKGAAGALGVPLSNEKAGTNYVYQEFAGGFIYAHTQFGVHHIVKSSAIGSTWYAGGKDSASGYGIPVSGNIVTTNGTYQQFSNSKWIFDNGYSIRLKGDIGTKWLASGGINSMGAPTATELCGLRDGGCKQVFKKATIFYSSKTGSNASYGAILGRYNLQGGPDGALGYPIGKESCGLVRGGCYQNFQNGLIMWSSATGAYSVKSGLIRNHYGSTGTASGFLGYPTAVEVCKTVGCFQYFQGGTVFYSAGTGAYSIAKGKIYDGFIRRGSYSGVLGFPKAQQVCGQPNGGCYQDFKNGRLWTNAAHSYAYMTKGGLHASYLAKGGPRSYLGYPISDERCSGGQCVQTFVGGYIGTGGDANGYYIMSECQNLNNGKSRYSTGGSKNVLLTFTSSYGQSYASNVYCKSIAGIYVAKWKTDGYVGTAGFKAPGQASGPTRYEYSPTGAYTVTEAFGLGNPGTKLAYRTLNPNSRWGGNPWTSTYNKYFESTSWIGYDENMWYFAKRGDYAQGAVINYNRPTITQNAGFAIFIHQNKIPTAGCISMDNWAMVDYLKSSVPGDRVIMGVKSAIFK